MFVALLRNVPATTLLEVLAHQLNQLHQNPLTLTSVDSPPLDNNKNPCLQMGVGLLPGTCLLHPLGTPPAESRMRSLGCGRNWSLIDRTCVPSCFPLARPFTQVWVTAQKLGSRYQLQKPCRTPKVWFSPWVVKSAPLSERMVAFLKRTVLQWGVPKCVYVMKLYASKKAEGCSSAIVCSAIGQVIRTSGDVPKLLRWLHQDLPESAVLGPDSVSPCWIVRIKSNLSAGSCHSADNRPPLGSNHGILDEDRGPLESDKREKCDVG
jgi:hypothetical protein